jgi:hypothetical protein
MGSQHSGKGVAVSAAHDGVCPRGGGMGEHVLTVGSTDCGLVIAIVGDFDADAARALLRTAAVAASARVPRIEVDLRGVTSASDDAVHAVTSCRRLSEQILHGVGFRVGELGQQLLLASVARDQPAIAVPAPTA